MVNMTKDSPASACTDYDIVPMTRGRSFAESVERTSSN